MRILSTCTVKIYGRSGLRTRSRSLGYGTHDRHWKYYFRYIIVSLFSLHIRCINRLKHSKTYIGILTNLPLVIFPPAAECIFLVTALQNAGLSAEYGNLAVVANGAFIVFMGMFGPLARLIIKFIPSSIQIGTTVGIGLLTTLAGAIEINLVQKGEFNVLKVGPVTPGMDKYYNITAMLYKYRNAMQFTFSSTSIPHPAPTPPHP